MGGDSTRDSLGAVSAVTCSFSLSEGVEDSLLVVGSAPGCVAWLLSD